ncbi:MAG: type II toxin-antitoxin system prevent-host-death family antitoxin [Candidatus Margulisbacteria bacterium]|jgi:prevent-host-death family protein|nr:type II toxin-antitoxin system prevent-host-death family antitoxin [Candidatus Margulisiibacteriota bacterium]
MQQINIHAAKTQLSALVERAAQGEPFIIAKAGKPMATVIPYQTLRPKPAKRVGFLKGQIKIPPDFDIDKIMEDEIIEMFYGPDGGDSRKS